VIPSARRGAGTSGPPNRFGRRALAGLCCGLLAAVAIGVAAGQNGVGSATRASAVAPNAPACANPGQTVERPTAVPANLLPAGTVLTSSENLGDGRTLVGGVVSKDFRAAVQFFVTELPKAGYVIGAGDAEMDEAEALFTGDGASGKWKVNGILNCPGAVTLALFVKR
jgi:hypothetical protein